MRRETVLAGLLVAGLASLLRTGSGEANELDIHIDLGGPPALVIEPGTPVYYAPAVPFNYFFYGGRYYVFAHEGWFAASSYNGPWIVVPVKKVPKPILEVPVEYYKVLPGHWKTHGPPPWAGPGKVHPHKKPKEK
jgi:hypothetical protein